MSYQQIMGVMSLPPDPPRVNNNNYICIKYCPKGLDHLKMDELVIMHHANISIPFSIWQ